MGFVPPKYLIEHLPKGGNMGCNDEFLKTLSIVREMCGDEFNSPCLKSYGRMIVSPGETMTHEGMLERLGDMNGEIKSQTDLKYINPNIEERLGTIEEIKEKRLQENNDKAIIGQWEQEKKYFSHVTLPVKLFKYWKAKIA